MPTKSYLDDHLKRLLDPEYASLYLAASFSEALEDGYIDGFLLALKNVVEATAIAKALAPTGVTANK